MSDTYEQEEEIDWVSFGLPQAFGKSNIKVATAGIEKKRIEEEEEESDTESKFISDRTNVQRKEKEVKKCGNFVKIGKKEKAKWINCPVKSKEHNKTDKSLVENLEEEEKQEEDDEDEEQDDKEQDDKEQEGEEQEEKKIKAKLPILYEVEIPAHQKTVSALDINRKGARMISGGFDYMVRLWDFNGMTTAMKSYRQIEPKEGLTIQSLCYSLSSSLFLCCIGGTVCNVYKTEDGSLFHQTLQGDMYIRDTANTKGHTHMTTDCKWHPTNNEVFITSALDATIRMWNITSKPCGVDQALPSIQCLKAVDRRNLNISTCHVLCCEYTKQSPKCIAGGCVNGSIQLWNEKSNYGKPDKVIKDAHKGEVVSLTFYRDDNRLLSRSLDETMKLWDLRQTSKHVFEWMDLPAFHSKTNICLSPLEDLILTGTQSNPKISSGKLFIYNSKTYEEIKAINFEGTGVVRTIWPSELNQIIVGCTNGKIKIFYDPKISSKGALLFVHRAPSYKADDLAIQKEIYTPESFPTGFKETRTGLFIKVKPRGKEKERIQRETQKTIVPPLPTGKEGAGGNFSQYSLRKFNSGATQREDAEEIDIVESLRAQANSSKDNEFFCQIYKNTQPHKILDYSMEQADDEELLKNVSKCPRCGLKLCQCGFMQNDDTLQGRYKQQRIK